jgi:hypothetical protein
MTRKTDNIHIVANPPLNPAAVHHAEPWLVLENQPGQGWTVIESWATEGQALHFANVLRRHDLEVDYIEHITDVKVRHVSDVTIRPAITQPGEPS